MYTFTYNIRHIYIYLYIYVDEVIGLLLILFSIPIECVFPSSRYICTITIPPFVHLMVLVYIFSQLGMFLQRDIWQP
jgi:hypothetical protein